MTLNAAYGAPGTPCSSDANVLSHLYLRKVITANHSDIYAPPSTADRSREYTPLSGEEETIIFSTILRPTFSNSSAFAREKDTSVKDASSERCFINMSANTCSVWNF